MYSKKEKTGLLFVVLIVLVSLLSFMSVNSDASADTGTVNLGTDTGVILSKPHNTRDLGGIINQEGYTIKSRLILRSDALSKMNLSDALVLKNDYGVTNVIDFRSKAETTSAPDTNKALFFYQHKPIAPQNYYLESNNNIKELVNKIKSGDQTGDAMMLSMYDYIADSKQSIAAYKDLFQTLLTNDNATLYHCTSGKDRTGVATALILSALNVDRGVINANYLESNQYRQEIVNADLTKAKKYTSNQRVLDILQDMESVKQPYLDEYFNELSKTYGGVDQYLHNQLGLTDQDVQQLQTKYLIK